MSAIVILHARGACPAAACAMRVADGAASFGFRGVRASYGALFLLAETARVLA